MPWWKIILIVLAVKVTLLVILVLIFSQKDVPENITYGTSFNTMYAQELGLDWKETYDAIIDDLGVKHLRLAAHWPMIQPAADEFNFTELDYQIKKAEEANAEVILAVGRRLPRWPECHIPDWAKKLTVEERNHQQLEYMQKVVERYRNSPAVHYWQVENEPFLSVFAFEYCGELDISFLEQEIKLVRDLDSTRSIIVTDSGNLGTWVGAYRHGDIFGTSVYVHFWNPDIGQFRTLLPPFFYRLKENVLAFLYGQKPTILVELSAEPWLIAPIMTVPIEIQFTRMNPEKFDDILNYAKQTRYDMQYLWGAEWWYWLTKNGHPEMWEKARELYKTDSN